MTLTISKGTQKIQHCDIDCQILNNFFTDLANKEEVVKQNIVI